MVETHEYGGFLWPINDKVTPPIVMKEVERLPQYLAHVPNRRVCVQAGGNVGVYAQRLAEHFEQVLTFEPDYENWHCLRRNITAQNVRAGYAALGAEPALIETWRTPKEVANYGATMVRPLLGWGGNAAVVVALDAYIQNLPSLDFLFLDVEGFELPALMGAYETIMTHQPVISVEIKGLGKHHGYKDHQILDYLQGMGYREADRIGRDVIFTHP